MRTNAHIVITQTLLPSHNPIDLELDFLDSKDLYVESHEHEPRAYASLEWIIPSFIAVYITKAYFEGFLNQMGADHYKQLKKWIQIQNKRFKKQITYKITATKATKKIQSSDSTSNYFAIYLMTPLGNYIKVFMPRCLTDEEDVQAISSLLDNFIMLYSEPKSDYSKKIQLLNDKVYENLYAVYNTKMRDWEIFTISTLVAKSHLNNAKEKKMIEIENIIKVKDGLVNSIELERFFPIVHKKLVQEHPEFHYSRRLIKIDRYMESIYNYSINIDALEANEDLFIPRVTFHKDDPSKTYTFFYKKAVSIKKAKNIATSLALTQLEYDLRRMKTD